MTASQIAFLLAGAALLATGCINARRVAVANEDGACELAKTVVRTDRQLPPSRIAYCDVIAKDDSPRGYYVMALYSDRRCDGVCSANMGWFAVEEATGEVFEWDVAEWKRGRPVDHEPPRPSRPQPTPA